MHYFRSLTKHPKDKSYRWATWTAESPYAFPHAVKFDHEDESWSPKEEDMTILEKGDKGYFPDPEEKQLDKAIKSPSYYILPNGIECKHVSQWFIGFKAQALQYIWRAGKKEGEPEAKELRKAIECLKIEISRLEEQNNS